MVGKPNTGIHNPRWTGRADNEQLTHQWTWWTGAEWVEEWKNWLLVCWRLQSDSCCGIITPDQTRTDPQDNKGWKKKTKNPQTRKREKHKKQELWTNKMIVAVADACLRGLSTWHAPIRGSSTQISPIKNMEFNLVGAISTYLHSTLFCLFYL